jgi:hypothetical protein
MGPFTIFMVVFIAAFCAGMFGMWLNGRLPDAHLDADSKEVIKLVTGLIGSMAALVLGLLVASANSNYNAQSSELQALSANVVLLDRILLSYGPEANSARQDLRTAIRAARERIWSPDGLKAPNLDAASKIIQRMQALDPKTDATRSAQARAIKLTDTIMQTRLLMFQQQEGAGLPSLFLDALEFWVCALFFGFGLLTRYNVTVASSLVVGAFSVGAAIFLILELNQPYQGFLQLSDAPLREALAQLGG